MRQPVCGDAYRDGPLAEFLAASLLDLSQTDVLPAPASQEVVFAPYLLQDMADYRGALQRWFDGVRIGGFLVITVPHAFLYERQDSAPSRRRATQRRLYTPRALIEEIEEALVPNSYRVRWLGDLDQGYDYSATEPVGRHDVAVVLERIAVPAWDLVQSTPSEPAPHDLFEADHTRIERVARAPAHKILALKLDHLGDFVMGIAALERLRAVFPAADITLVVGSWNESLAHTLGVADRVVVFDAYPRNSSEEKPDIGGKTAMFDALITERYDLAIDLRTNMDSRFLLRNVHASIKAGLGLAADFPFLDIFLPVEAHIGHYDMAWSEEFGPDSFRAQDYCTRSSFSIACPGDRVRPGYEAIVFGPYRSLPPGHYVFEPFVEIEQGGAGLLAGDVALNTHRVGYEVLPDTQTRLSFENQENGAQFEFRLFPVADEPAPNFRFYGGRLSKRGTASALHQSEYLILLVELIALRVKETGLFGEDAP
ncbi:glycosyltransferase family 9 protein [Sphingomonas crusticola]|uniref:glycosyltransferase family 9 protein n=1 Tax=Sphingomonas crusticola TaxID=1697973 RepID=UPI000E236BD2|nr:hypothetical protein [Sphingomonas crusticola]